MWILLTAGTGVNQLREIGAYDGGSKIASVTQQWSVVPDQTTQYLISSNPFQTLAAAPYPFNLPANMPLIETRSYLAALGTSLPEVYGALSAPVARGQAQAATADSLTLAASASGTANAYVPMTLRLTGGAGAGQRQVTATTAPRARPPWTTWLSLPDASTRYAIIDPLAADRETAGLNIEQYRVVTTPVSDAATLASHYGYATLDLKQLRRVSVFLASTGLDWDQLQFLLTQGLSAAEQRRAWPTPSSSTPPASWNR